MDNSRTSEHDYAEHLDDVLADYLDTDREEQLRQRPRLLARHPELAAALTAFFADQDGTERLVAALRHPERSSVHESVSISIPDFEVVDEIARGGMGVVYRARQKSLNRLVALKLLRHGEAADTIARQRFHGEAEAVAALDHPHIVPIFHVGEHEGQPFFVMKLLEGGNLAARVPSLVNDCQASARLMITLAEAVHYAHQHGILHRDLKPANILLDSLGQPHVTDFGLAIRVATPDAAAPLMPLTQTGALLGTPSYMAPEQALGRRSAVTVATDVYGLGAILYELLTGQPPFQGPTLLATLQQIQEQDPLPPRRLNTRLHHDLETICLKCLEKDPSKRYASAAELATDLKRWLAGESIHARPVGRVVRFWRFCRRKPILAGLAAALVVVSVTGISSVLWQWQRAERHRADSDHHAQEAELSFQEAHAAINDFCIRMSDDRLNKLAGAQPLRRELLIKALHYYQNFLQRRSDDPHLQRELAATYFRIGTIATDLGLRKEAFTAYQEALNRYQQLSRARPEDVALRAEVARCHARIGFHEAANGRGETALTSYRTALDMFTALSNEVPDSLDYPTELAALNNSLGVLYRRQARLAEARSCYERHIAFMERLLRQRPGNRQFEEALALGLANLGAYHANLDERGEALEWYEKARKIQERLLAAPDASFTLKCDLARTYRQVSSQFRLRGQVKEVQHYWKLGNDLVTEIVKANPSVMQFQRDLAVSYRMLGINLWDDKQPDKSARAFDQSCAIVDSLLRFDPENEAVQIEKAEVLFERASVEFYAGKTRQALTTFEEVRDQRSRLLAQNAEDVGHRSALGLTWFNVGVCLANLDRMDDAIAAERQALVNQRLVFERSPDIPRHRRELNGTYAILADLLRRKGKAAEAMEITLRRCRLWPGNPTQLFSGARDLGLVVGKVVPGTQLSDEQQALRSQCAAQAVDLLRQAIASGFKDKNRINQEEAFAGLRDREDFQALLSQMK
jgi:tetratricopeptide (TPR) repeat protein/tRNA A-37 threonylcarbamoyl transferase component Bud32